MTRSLELHELFSEWLSTRGVEAAEDPPRDLALHAAGCERCLRSASAIDTLGVIDVGAAAPPPVRVAPTDEPWRLIVVARYAAAGVALVLLAGSVAIGSSWLGSVRPTASTELRSTPGEGVLAGVPSASVTSTPTPSEKPSTSPSDRESSSVAPSQAPTEVAVAPTIIIPAPTYQPPSPPPPTTGPTPAPTATPIPPTATPIPTSPPTPTPTLPPPPTPTPTASPIPDDCEDGIDNDLDTFTDADDPGCVLSGNEADA